MARQSWVLKLHDGPHVVQAAYGYWFGKATLRVDGRIVTADRRLTSMARDRGIDLLADVGGHQLVVPIRPKTLGRSWLVTGYSFALRVDGEPAPGTGVLPPLSPGSGPFAAWWPESGARQVEALTWAAAVGGVVGLSHGGTNPVALLYLAAPLSCSVLTRRARLSTGSLGILCLGIMFGWLVVVAFVGAEA